MTGAAGILLYLLFWPLPLEPAPWTPPPAPAAAGPYEANRRLAGVERLGQGMGVGPEDVALGSEGRIYTGLEDGRIVRWRPGRDGPRDFASTGGRPLGLEARPPGDLLVADSRRGLLRVDRDGRVQGLAGRPEVPQGWANGLSVAPDGVVYFTNPSSSVPVRERRTALLSGRPDGRVLAHDPRTGETRTVLDSLYFPNGVAVDPDGRFLLVAEMGRYRLRRHWLRGDRAGETEVIASNLPGFPDGVSIDPRGDVWIALVARRSRMLDTVRPSRLLTGALMRMARIWAPDGDGQGMVVRLDGEGRPLESLQAPSGGYGWISSVVPSLPFLYLGSVREEAVGRLPLPPDQEKVAPLDTAALRRQASVDARFLLEKSVFNVDVLTLEVMFGPATAARLDEVVRAHGPDGVAVDSASAVVMGADAVLATVVFHRGFSFDRFVDGTRSNLERLGELDAVSEADARRIRQELPGWYPFLRERGVEEDDRMTLAIRGDTVRTVYRGPDGEVLHDDTVVSRDLRHSVLGRYFAPGSDFREGVLRSLLEGE